MSITIFLSPRSEQHEAALDKKSGTGHKRHIKGTQTGTKRMFLVPFEPVCSRFPGQSHRKGTPNQLKDVSGNLSRTPGSLNELTLSCGWRNISATNPLKI